MFYEIDHSLSLAKVLTYIQHTVECATSVIALECCDLSLGVAVWVSW